MINFTQETYDCVVVINLDKSTHQSSAPSKYATESSDNINSINHHIYTVYNLIFIKQNLLILVHSLIKTILIYLIFTKKHLLNIAFIISKIETGFRQDLLNITEYKVLFNNLWKLFLTYNHVLGNKHTCYKNKIKLIKYISYHIINTYNLVKTLWCLLHQPLPMVNPR